MLIKLIRTYNLYGPCAGNEETADMVREVGAPVFADVCDLSDKEDVKRAAKKAREQFGDITILVNNAGR